MFKIYLMIFFLNLLPFCLADTVGENCHGDCAIVFGAFMGFLVVMCMVGSIYCWYKDRRRIAQQREDNLNYVNNPMVNPNEGNEGNLTLPLEKTTWKVTYTYNLPPSQVISIIDNNQNVQIDVANLTINNGQVTGSVVHNNIYGFSCTLEFTEGIVKGKGLGDDKDLKISGNYNLTNRKFAFIKQDGHGIANFQGIIEDNNIITGQWKSFHMNDERGNFTLALIREGNSHHDLRIQV
jgi:hypothetical protein